jgi:hypothetical protein
VSAAILHQQLPPLPDHLPVSVQSIIRRALARDRHERYAHAVEVAAAIEAVRAELTAGTPQHGTVAAPGGGQYSRVETPSIDSHEFCWPG